jgi:hypothetical protein
MDFHNYLLVAYSLSENRENLHDHYAPRLRLIRRLLAWCSRQLK